MSEQMEGVLIIGGTSAAMAVVFGLLIYAARRAPAAWVRAVWLAAIALAAVAGYAGNELTGAGIAAALVGIPYVMWENGR